MDDQIQVNLKDFYSLVLWNPKMAEHENSKGISAGFFFKCLYQLTNDSDRPEANLLLAKITQELTHLVDAMQLEIAAINEKLPDACILKRKLSSPPPPILISHDDGLCKANAVLLRTIVTFDNLLSLIYQSYLLSVSKQKDYYKLRRHWARRIRFVLETSFFELKQLHKDGELKK